LTDDLANFEATVVVERVLSQLDRGCIFAGRTDGDEPIRVKFSGQDTQPLPGDAFVVQGLITKQRDRFGNAFWQVETKRMRRTVSPGDLLGPWLERLPNIGATRAKRLVDTFGHNLPNVLADFSQASTVGKVIEPTKPALAAKITAQLYAAVASQTGANQLRTAEIEFLIFLETLGIKESRIAGQLWRFMAGPNPVERLRRNPYVMASLLEWRPADRVGKRLLRSVDEGADLMHHPARCLGAVNSAWRHLLSSGDTAALESDFSALLTARDVDPKTTLLLAEESGSLRRIGTLLRAPGAAWQEDQITSAFLAMEKAMPTVALPTGPELEDLVHGAESSTGMVLTDEQHTAVVKLLTLQVAALQGGAGVGKTTVMKVLATAWEDVGGNVVMGALAGKAALTLSRGASTAARPRLAYTVARLIGMLERQSSQLKGGESKALASDVAFTAKTLLIIDEAGMMDTPSLHKMLTMLPEGARILFAGDEGQLPPVGIGKIFHDIVGEGSRVARLTKVLRQAADSEIPRTAASIRSGRAPQLQKWEGQSKGVYLMPIADLERLQMDLRPNGDLMVVAAKRATVEAINENEAQKGRTASTPTRRLGALATVAEGDPVVATANRYQDGLFNGLLGVVTSIDGPEATVKWDGEESARSLPQAAEAEIELAYAITCHKAQGSSAHAVIVVCEDTALVTREWLYTGVTRGRELVIIVGDIAVLNKAIDRRTTRMTGFTVGPLAQH
jgi:exodeoxyribonuclease V alpha subunit